MFTDEQNPALRALAEYAEARRLFWLDPPRGACGQPGGCALGDTAVILHTADDGLQRCATHHALLVPRKHPYPCDNCGRGPAFRDPAHRRDEYLCPDCHKEHDGYVPTARSMVNKTAARVGAVHSRGQKAVCLAAGRGTDCHGQIKQRSSKGVLCDFHADPVKYLKARQA
jgi:hypothetical protein